MKTLNIAIFAIDDNHDDLENIQMAITEIGEANYKLFQYADKLIEELTEDFHIVIIDQYLPGGRTGLDVLKEIKKKSPGSYTIGYSGCKDPEALIRYIQIGIDDWVEKKLDGSEFPELVAALKEGIDIAPVRIGLASFLKEKTKNEYP